jgi:hypothetical protein
MADRLAIRHQHSWRGSVGDVLRDASDFALKLDAHANCAAAQGKPTVEHGDYRAADREVVARAGSMNLKKEGFRGIPKG